MVRPSEPKDGSRSRRRPAKTPEAQENRMISLAVDLAERQLMEGSASTPVIVHYLKLATAKEKLEQEKLARENELLKAKAEQIESAQKIEEMYSQALNAMKAYSGTPVQEEISEDEFAD